MKRSNQTSGSEREGIAVAPPPSSRAVPRGEELPHVDDHPVVNQAAIDLLLSWQAGDEQEQRDTWEYLKRVLEEDRLSDRSLLP